MTRVCVCLDWLSRTEGVGIHFYISLENGLRFSEGLARKEQVRLTRPVPAQHCQTRKKGAKVTLTTQHLPKMERPASGPKIVKLNRVICQRGWKSWRHVLLFQQNTLEPSANFSAHPSPPPKVLITQHGLSVEAGWTKKSCYLNKLGCDKRWR